MQTDLYLFQLHHVEDESIRHELVYGARNLKDAQYQIAVIWPSYSHRQCLRIAEGIESKFWDDYLAMCERAKRFNAGIRALIVGDLGKQQWGMAYQNRAGLLSAICHQYPLPRSEFRLNNEFLAYAALDFHNFYQIEAKAYMPRFVSFWGDSL